MLWNILVMMRQPRTNILRRTFPDWLTGRMGPSVWQRRNEEDDVHSRQIAIGFPLGANVYENSCVRGRRKHSKVNIYYQNPDDMSSSVPTLTSRMVAVPVSYIFYDIGINHSVYTWNKRLRNYCLHRLNLTSELD